MTPPLFLQAKLTLIARAHFNEAARKWKTYMVSRRNVDLDQWFDSCERALAAHRLANRED